MIHIQDLSSAVILKQVRDSNPLDCTTYFRACSHASSPNLLIHLTFRRFAVIQALQLLKTIKTVSLMGITTTIKKLIHLSINEFGIYQFINFTISLQISSTVISSVSSTTSAASRYSGSRLPRRSVTYSRFTCPASTGLSV